MDFKFLALVFSYFFKSLRWIPNYSNLKCHLKPLPRTLTQIQNLSSNQNGSEEENTDWTTDYEEEILGTGTCTHPTLTVRNESTVGNGEVNL